MQALEWESLVKHCVDMLCDTGKCMCKDVWLRNYEREKKTGHIWAVKNALFSKVQVPPLVSCRWVKSNIGKRDFSVHSKKISGKAAKGLIAIQPLYCTDSLLPYLEFIRCSPERITFKVWALHQLLYCISFNKLQVLHIRALNYFCQMK